MATMLLTRIDQASESQPRLQPKNDQLARADGLTMREAAELVKWLTEAGYTSVDVIPEADHASVVWRP